MTFFPDARPDRRWLILTVLGLAQLMVVSTLAVSATADAPAGRPGTPQLAAAAAAHGYTTAFWVSAALLAAGAAVSGALLHGGRRKHRPADRADATASAEPVLVH